MINKGEFEMKDISKIDFTPLDRPEVLMFLFHPRPESNGAFSKTADPQKRDSRPKDILISVETDIAIGARFHMAEKTGGNLLFFHGNGEIVADYDELGAVYNQSGINLLAVDYRGYGRSGGKPTVTAMMQDCHIIFHFVLKWLQQNNFTGPLLLMGRSLGSASVLELAVAYKNLIDGLIVESGFAYAGPLLTLLGIDFAALGFKEEKGFRNVDKMRNFD
jgi:alpha-beta hydrolase superfamily lysophospholipase